MDCITLTSIDNIMATTTDENLKEAFKAEVFTNPKGANKTFRWDRVKTGFILDISSGPVLYWGRWNAEKFDSEYKTLFKMVDKEHQDWLKGLGCSEHPRIITIGELEAAFEDGLPPWIQKILQSEKDKAALDVSFGWTTLRFQTELTDLSAQRIHMPPPSSRSSFSSYHGTSTSGLNDDAESRLRSWDNSSIFE